MPVQLNKPDKHPFHTWNYLYLLYGVSCVVWACLLASSVVHNVSLRGASTNISELFISTVSCIAKLCLLICLFYHSRYKAASLAVWHHDTPRLAHLSRCKATYLAIWHQEKTERLRDDCPGVDSVFKVCTSP